MTRLDMPGGWADRKAEELRYAIEPEDDKFVYIGSCVEMDGETITNMQESDEWEDKTSRENREEQLKELRERCSNFNDWARVMGYADDPEDGLLIENDWSLNYGKGMIDGVLCYWVDHSRIEYIWADPNGMMTYNTVGTMTGRMSCKSPNLANKPMREMRKMAKTMNFMIPDPYSFGGHSVGSVKSISREDAQEMLEKFRNSYPAVLTPAEKVKLRAAIKKGEPDEE